MSWEESDEDALVRFQIELEFVQCLANPHYLFHLAQHGHLRDESFINYLHYLCYFQRVEYARFIKFPQSLFFLAQLQHAAFRDALLNKSKIDLIAEQQYYHWVAAGE